ncbi:MAG: isoprenyl transferase [Bacteroides sp.]
MLNKEYLDTNNIPKHIAIIMDGNGRWAKQRNKERSFGHQAGADTVYKTVEQAAKLGVRYLTLYTFSSENWNRPETEITALMTLLMESLDDKLFMENDIKFAIIGEEDRLPENVREKLNSTIQKTRQNKRMTLVLALSYSSHWELTEATKKIAAQVKEGKLEVEEITPDIISQNLATHFMPNPDLLIRTGGEYRLSNYLLWQCAYTEFYFCDTYWPDFSEQHFIHAIIDYQQRERRFGKTSEQVNK